MAYPQTARSEPTHCRLNFGGLFEAMGIPYMIDLYFTSAET